MSTTTARPITAGDLWLLPGDPRWRELVRGVVVESPPPGGEHGVIVANFGLLLLQWTRANGAGVVGTKAGFVLDRDPNTVLGPDLHLVRAERLPDGRTPMKFYDFAPNLAVEVISPSATAETVQERVRDYLAAGTSIVVLVSPRTRTLLAHAADGSARTYRDDETFSSPALLPDFSCSIAEIFA